MAFRQNKYNGNHKHNNPVHSIVHASFTTHPTLTAYAHLHATNSAAYPATFRSNKNHESDGPMRIDCVLDNKAENALILRTLPAASDALVFIDAAEPPRAARAGLPTKSGTKACEHVQRRHPASSSRLCLWRGFAENRECAIRLDNPPTICPIFR